MYKKEIDEIYELCKRVANEVPTANASFNYSIYGMSVCGLRRKEDVNLPEDKFKWDLYQSVSFNPFYEKESRESLKIIKTFLLELFGNGQVFAYIVLDKIAEAIAPEIEKRKKKMQAAVNKYVEKYTK